MLGEHDGERLTRQREPGKRRHRGAHRTDRHREGEGLRLLHDADVVGLQRMLHAVSDVQRRTEAFDRTDELIVDHHSQLCVPV
jgi:hypothetical protein